jgi:transcriptional regulator with XRE-family HTH domain
MSGRERPADVGTRRATTILHQIGDEIHEARLGRGLSHAEVARSAGVPQTRLSRIERQLQPNATVRDIACLLAVVGLEFSGRAYPTGPRIRDAAQLALLDRLRDRVDPALKWRVEVPIPIPGDQRAWDAVIEASVAERMAVEPETRIRDLQAVQRRIALKLRDDPSIRCVLLLLAATHSNRVVVRDHVLALESSFPSSGRAVLSALGSGRVPSASGLVLL